MSNGARSILFDDVRRPSADRGCRRARRYPRRFDRDRAHPRGCGDRWRSGPDRPLAEAACARQPRTHPADRGGSRRRASNAAKLLAGVAKARGWLDELIAGRVLDIAEIAQREKRSIRSTAMLLSLAFLAPRLVQAIADNRMPRGIGLTRLADLPSDWSEQFKALGLQAPR